ncbi:hypothetical protein GCM10011344_19840 [Dokdonia pacifica]|uniref:Lipocalin-like domain-containing protein n=1 Tax=Dokdonia pacifica TaxID=1627892 RepID=A0A238VP99_9FLAO|nr:hypothetical protein [Dokdonia pacifica]GGG19254.1 hypothetical protein GCM10011344_19840 [Dokdonia pacifica]SNR36180.1 hypothetical protein SAMN06265376_101149 [Dokdonia pacifica]
MRKFIIVFLVAFSFYTCSSDDTDTMMEEEQMEEQMSSEGCDGDTCEATVGADETSATVPDTAFGTFNVEYTFADTGSPFELGTTAVFIVKSDQTLSVEIEGFECITISNPIWRFGADETSGNYTFQDECRDMLSYNLSYNTDGSFNEVNIEPSEGPGFFGQFTLQ